MTEVSEKVVKEEVFCAHCKETCDDVQISFEDNNFCCLGCKTVYQILHDNGLDAYYRMEQNPGVSLKKRKRKDLYAVLDREEIQRQLLDFSEGDLSKVRFFIPTIHCSSCMWLLENLHNLHEGVIRSTVNFPRKELSADFNPKLISLRALVELLETLGYGPEINVESSIDRNPIEGKRRDLLVKIGVSGFAFGNVMLFSFPEYVGLDRIIDPQFSRFFSYVSLAFCLPVLFYSATDYFQAAYKGLKQGMISIDVPIVIGIFTLFFRSVYEVLTMTGPGYFDSLSGLVFFLLIGKWFQSKTYDNLLFDRNYKSYFPIAITRLTGSGAKDSVPIGELKTGDRILIRNEELIPADAILIEGKARIDNSFVTGESKPIPKKIGDYIYAGGRQMGASIELEIVKDVSQSYLTQLWNVDSLTVNNGPGQRALINKISKYFTVVVLILAIVAGVYWLVIDPSIAMNAFTAVLIVACPCALALSTPFAVGTAMRILGNNECYLKNGGIVEALAHIDHIVFDKTGTITVQNSNEKIEFVGDLDDEEKRLIFHLSTHSSHPLSRVLAANLSNGYPQGELSMKDFVEVRGQGIAAIVNDNKVKIGSATFIGAADSQKEDPRTSKVFVSVNTAEKGYFMIRNIYRPDFEKLIKDINSEYILAMLSGDNSAEKSFLEQTFPAQSELRFQQTAFEKLDFVKQKHEEGHKVLMLGDGLNDAGALAEASVGIAVTDDINNFTPASDIILSGKRFGKLRDILAFSKATFNIIIISFILSFLYNIVGLSFAISGNLTPVFAAILMPLSSISVVLFATLSVNFIARKIGLG